MTKEDFLEHLGEVLYRIEDATVRNELWRAANRYKNDLPSPQDQDVLDQIKQLNQNVERLEETLAVSWPRRRQKESKSIETIVREINTENLKEMTK